MDMLSWLAIASYTIAVFSLGYTLGNEGGDNVDMLSWLAIASYTIAVFSLGYTLGKDYVHKQK